jgi:hypothetical protein
VKVAIPRSTERLRFIKYGIDEARRGGGSRDSIKRLEFHPRRLS